MLKSLSFILISPSMRMSYSADLPRFYSLRWPLGTSPANVKQHPVHGRRQQAASRAADDLRGVPCDSLVQREEV